MKRTAAGTDARRGETFSPSPTGDNTRGETETGNPAPFSPATIGLHVSLALALNGPAVA